MLLVHLDDYHLGDPLFPQALAQALARPGRPPLLLVHGSGEAAEQRLEAEGLFVERVGGVLQVQSAAERALVERAMRELNQQLVAALTDALVPAVGLHGMDRGLLRWTPEAGVAAGRVGWLEAVVRQGGVPVLSALVADPEGGAALEVPVAEVLPALADAWPTPPTVVLLTKNDRPGYAPQDEAVEAALVADVPAAVLPERALAERVVAAGRAAAWGVVLTSLHGLPGEGGRAGTRLE